MTVTNIFTNDTASDADEHNTNFEDVVIRRIKNFNGDARTTAVGFPVASGVTFSETIPANSLIIGINVRFTLKSSDGGENASANIHFNGSFEIDGSTESDFYITQQILRQNTASIDSVQPYADTSNSALMVTNSTGALQVSANLNTPIKVLSSSQTITVGFGITGGATVTLDEVYIDIVYVRTFTDE